LVEVLKVVDSAEVTLDLKEANRPGLLKSSPDYQYVVMPVSLS
jgi:DNA polymerase III sliding clamp (beta) subunit (PCNA family)